MNKKTRPLQYVLTCLVLILKCYPYLYLNFSLCKINCFVKLCQIRQLISSCKEKNENSEKRDGGRGKNKEHSAVPKGRQAEGKAENGDGKKGFQGIRFSGFFLITPAACEHNPTTAGKHNHNLFNIDLQDKQDGETVLSFQL